MSLKKQLEENIHELKDLPNLSSFSTSKKKKLKKLVEKHPMSITKYYSSLIDWNDPEDPLKKLVVPSLGELSVKGSYDTSGEKKSTVMPGLQHKYKQTALIIATNRCAVYCRFCFRKRMVGLSNKEVISRFEKAMEYIREHKEIKNILITGGDPLVLPTKVIENLLENLSGINHLDFVRFGTRIPVVMPERITKDSELLRLFEKYSRKDRRIYIVTHFNHPREITEKSIEAVDSLLKSGVIINNQTVLMKGVNDKPEILAELMNKLVKIGVSPYYVFQCRPVKRVKAHFQVPLKQGYEIIEKAKAKMSGHSKRFKYMMSHETGKIEILGIKNNEIYFKYHQARNPKNLGKFFKRKLTPTAGWLDDLDS